MTHDGPYIRKNYYQITKWIRPTADDVECLITNRRRGYDWTNEGYYGTLLRMLLAGFCILIACTPVLSEDIFKPTGRYAETATCVELPASSSGSYLVCFSGPSCAPCQAWKRSERKKIEDAGHKVTVVETDHAKWGVSRIPQFWIVDRATKKPTEKITGYTSAETLLTKLGTGAQSETARTQMVVVNQAGPLSNDIYNGNEGSSHKDRASLINHLLNQGIHAGKHSKEKLEAMTDGELNYLHESDHGWSHVDTGRTSQTIQTSTRQTKQRGFLFWRW